MAAPVPQALVDPAARRRIRALAGAALAAWLCLPAAGQGFFRVAQEQGRFWLLDPEGRPFFSTGVDYVQVGPDPRKLDPKHPAYAGLAHHAGFEAWQAATTGRLLAWGFNTLGPWGEPRLVDQGQLPYTVCLHLGQWVGAPWLAIGGEPALASLRERIEAEVRPRRDDRRLVGYFVDNELGWYTSALLSSWAREGSEQRLKQGLYGLLREEYQGDLGPLLQDFSVAPRPARFEALLDPLQELAVRPGRRPAVVERFAELLADDYYRVVAAAVRAADPNHLLLGDRFASFYSQAVARACARHMDVVSVNYNSSEPGWSSPAFFDTLHRLTGKPLLVSEFYAAARENRSNDTNRHGSFLVVGTQRERARAVARQAEGLARLPYVVGYHWFQWSDEPPGGRSLDGEDYNMGLVDIEDRPYEELTLAFARVNRAAPDLHRAGPLAQGLARADGAWAVPALPRSVLVDGRLDDWELARHWVPEVGAREGFLPFGDFYLGWTPSALKLALGYYDDSLASPQRSNLLSRRRLAVVAGVPGASPARLCVVGFDERSGRRARLGLLEPMRLPRAALPVGALQGFNLLTTAELVLPARLFGRGRLGPGDRLLLALRLAMEGETKELLWPAPAEPPATLVLAAPAATSAPSSQPD